MKWNELLRKLSNAGYVKLRDAKGSHQIWHNPEIKDSEMVIAYHPSKEIGKGLASKLLKQAGIK